MNITDVADRLIERAEKSKKDPLELAREYERAFLEDMKALGITNVEHYERASDYIPQIMTQIKALMEKEWHIRQRRAYTLKSASFQSSVSCPV